MADGIVDTGPMADLASLLTKKLGRRVVIHRVEYKIRLPGGRQKTETKYSIGITGSFPPVFFNLTVNECKSRMAFLLDLLSSGVVHANPNADASADPGTDRQVPVGQEPSPGPCDPSGPQGHASVRDEGDNQSPNADDRY